MTPMPETPDFDQIAREVGRGLVVLNVVADQDRAREAFQKDLAEQLRLAWNARGAADIAAIELELSTVMGSTMAGPYIKNLDRALRRLDR
jgi:hypothetical protein